MHNKCMGLYGNLAQICEENKSIKLQMLALQEWIITFASSLTFKMNEMQRKTPQ